MKFITFLPTITSKN